MPASWQRSFRRLRGRPKPGRRLSPPARKRSTGCRLARRDETAVPPRDQSKSSQSRSEIERDVAPVRRRRIAVRGASPWRRAGRGSGGLRRHPSAGGAPNPAARRRKSGIAAASRAAGGGRSPCCRSQPRTRFTWRSRDRRREPLE